MNLGSFRLGGTRMRMLACLALLPLTGCGMTGKWALVSVDPDAARRDVEFHSIDPAPFENGGVSSAYESFTPDESTRILR